MRMINMMIFSVLFSSFTTCGSRDQSPGKAAADSVPKVDLHSAVVTDDLDVIRQHIKAGSDLNVLEPSRASTPLITAAALGRVEAAKLLIDAGADLNYQNADGSTALHTAVVFGRNEIARMLIDAGIDLNVQNNDGATALHTAAFFGKKEIVEALLQKGADKTLKNQGGKTAYETVAGPFEEVESVYNAISAALKPLGVSLDYDKIKAERPEIAAMLK